MISAGAVFKQYRSLTGRAVRPPGIFLKKGFFGVLSYISTSIKKRSLAEKAAKRQVSTVKVTFAEVDLHKVYPEKEYVITEEKIRAYLAATGDWNPLYEQKRLVPPAMAAVFTRWEALSGEELLPGTIHAGQAFRYLQPLHWGDKVILRGKVVEKTEKRGLKFVVREVQARLETGEPAIVSRITVILPE